jgi:hypothetical protein
MIPSRLHEIKIRNVKRSSQQSLCSIGADIWVCVNVWAMVSLRGMMNGRYDCMNGNALNNIDQVCTIDSKKPTDANI